MQLLLSQEEAAEVHPKLGGKDSSFPFNTVLTQPGLVSELCTQWWGSATRDRQCHWPGSAYKESETCLLQELQSDQVRNGEEAASCVL